MKHIRGDCKRAFTTAMTRVKWLILLRWFWVEIWRLLSGNRFSGHIPEELGRLENLTRMQLDENQITGPVPLSFGNLLAMEHL